MKTLKQTWQFEKENYLGDYGDSNEFDLYCAFKAGWLAGKRYKKNNSSRRKGKW